MKKRILALALALTMTLAACVVAPDDDTEFTLRTSDGRTLYCESR